MVLLASTLTLAIWYVRRKAIPKATDTPLGPDPPYQVPPITYDTPYRNARPGVQYVGSHACAGCHKKESASFAKHSMGRSAAAMAHAADQDRYDEASHNPFEKLGTLFHVEREGTRVVHKAKRPAAGGTALFEAAQQIDIVVGSGERGRAYLINHGGYLYQSPMNWYTHAQTWDLAPNSTPEMLFDRAIDSQCVQCHLNDARPVKDSVNHYELPLAREYAIGCERCHGPGELHVKARRAEALEVTNDDAAEETIDDTIVNPARLNPALRDAVCEQCHLLGVTRVVRRGRDVFDFRPGLRLHEFFSIFMLPPERTDPKTFSESEQMRMSRCYQKSNGQLGCISCHDPHVLPAEADKASYYRRRCQECHGKPDQKMCTVPPAERRAKNGDACHACHVPRQASNLVHTAVSDHRVLRRPSADAAPPPYRPLPGDVPLVHFHRDLTGDFDMEVRRDMGLALVELARRFPNAVQPITAAARPLLDTAIRQTPDDVPTREARGYLLWQQGDDRRALEDFEAVLARAPNREMSLLPAAHITTALGKLDASADYWRRLITVNPWHSPYHAGYAQLLLGRGDLALSRDACEAALRLNPASTKARQVLVEVLLRLGEREQARKEFDVLLGVAPPARVNELRRWYEEWTRR